MPLEIIEKFPQCPGKSLIDFRDFWRLCYVHVCYKSFGPSVNVDKTILNITLQDFFQGDATSVLAWNYFIKLAVDQCYVHRQDLSTCYVALSTSKLELKFKWWKMDLLNIKLRLGISRNHSTGNKSTVLHLANIKSRRGSILREVTIERRSTRTKTFELSRKSGNRKSPQSISAIWGQSLLFIRRKMSPIYAYRCARNTKSGCNTVMNFLDPHSCNKLR